MQRTVQRTDVPADLSRSFGFFFQAEDGIRDLTVTGVQTCALPISAREDRLLRGGEPQAQGPGEDGAGAGGAGGRRVRPGRRGEDPRALEAARGRAEEEIGRASCRERV